MDLSDFLLARIADDERAAQSEWDWMIERHGPDFWSTGEGAVMDSEWSLETDRDATLHVSPRRVLAECGAKRRIVELHREELIERLDDEFPGTPYDALCVVDNDDFPCTTLRLLALPYAEHPDYDPEWKV